MASELAVTQNNQSRALKEMRDDFENKKQELVEQNESKLKNLQADYQKREDKIYETGEATVNHIKKLTEERVENQRSAADTLANREQEKSVQNYQALRKRNQTESLSLEQAYQDKLIKSEAKVNELQNRENTLNQRVHEEEKKTLSEAQKRRQLIVQSSEEETQKVQLSGNEKLNEIHAKNDQAIHTLQEGHNKKYQELKTVDDQQYQQEKSRSANQLKTLESETSQSAEKRRTGYNQSITQMDRKYHDTTQTIQRQNEKQVSDLELQNQNKVNELRDQGIAAAHDTQIQYKNEMERVENKGQAELMKEKDKLATQLKAQDKDLKAQIKTDEEQLKKLEQDQQQTYEQRRGDLLDIQSKNIKELDKEYHNRFDHNADSYRESLNNQKQNYLKMLYKQNVKAQDQLSLNDQQNADPFYQLRDLDARMSETDGAYIFKAKVPAFEKDNVTVHVKDDKLVLQAARSHEKKVEDGSQKASTSSYQTHRQEFKLPMPVVASQIIKHLDDDGTITVTVPKKNFSLKA